MLDDRKAAILRAVVQQYVETAQPVGSSGVANDPAISVSSATVRNEMTSLERDGYLIQPHTSAGRIPTEKGYRFFVDALGDPGDLGPVQIRQVSQFFSHVTGELEGMLQNVSHLLSRMTATAAVVIEEPNDTAVIRSVQLVPLSAGTILLVGVTSKGDVIKRTIERSSDADDDVVAAAQIAVSVAAIGSTASATPMTRPTGNDAVDSLARDAVAVLQASGAKDHHRMFMDGTSQIAAAFDAADTVREVLVILEQQITVVSLLHDVLDRGMRVAIGSETGVAPLAECSVVVAPFMVDGIHAGTIGVLGPTRMNYRDTLAAVGAVSNRLSTLLTEG